MAEIAVRPLRTEGFWMYADDFFTVQINAIFHVMDISAHTDPRTMIPNPRDVSLGMKAGIKATA